VARGSAKQVRAPEALSSSAGRLTQPHAGAQALDLSPQAEQMWNQRKAEPEAIESLCHAWAEVGRAILMRRKEGASG